MTQDIQSRLIRFRQDARDLVKQLYRDEQGNPFILTDGQCDIFNLIFKKLTPRVHIESFTRYGKSNTVAMAILTRICTFPEKWCIAAGNEDQAKIIMSHLIQHIFDNEFTRKRFVIGKGESEEAIKRHRSKDRLNFKLENGLLGEVFVTNAAGAMGYGAPNVVHDEAALTPDNEEALVFRMLGDQTENFYCKIGNPWESGHFRQSANDPNFFRVSIDYYQGIKEGRIVSSLVEEARKKPYFDVLYECKFPKGGTTGDGWIPLLDREDIDRALVDTWTPFGASKLGGDVAGGGKNFSVLVQRTHNMARILLKNKEPDTMKFAEAVISHSGQEMVRLQDVHIDCVGIGRGVVDILARQEKAKEFQGVNVGDKFEDGDVDGDLYLNLRAKIFWDIRTWILAGGKLLRDGNPETNWYQLAQILYNHKLEGLKGKLRIMPKEQMLKLGIPSPDVADSLALTFAGREAIVDESYIRRIAQSAESGPADPY